MSALTFAVKSAMQDIRAKEATGLIVMWFTMFILTLFFSELSMRSLFAAMCAWVGGVITAELNKRFTVIESLLKRSNVQYSRTHA